MIILNEMVLHKTYVKIHNGAIFRGLGKNCILESHSINFLINRLSFQIQEVISWTYIKIITFTLCFPGLPWLPLPVRMCSRCLWWWRHVWRREPPRLVHVSSELPRWRPRALLPRVHTSGRVSQPPGVRQPQVYRPLRGSVWRRCRLPGLEPQGHLQLSEDHDRRPLREM